MTSGKYIKTEQHKKNLSIALTGRKLKPISEEHKRKISLSITGYKNPMKRKEIVEKVRAKITGLKRSPEIRAKLSLIRKGIKHNWTNPKLRGQRISKSKMGVSLSEETKKNMSISKIGLFSGYKHPNWKGGITAINKLIRHSNKYKIWRSQVFKRDSWTCQTCNKLGHQDLEAHHKKTFSEILRDNNIKTLNDAFECIEIWDINNGVTLCKTCHNLTRGYIKK